MDKKLIERLAIETGLMYRNAEGLGSPKVEDYDCTEELIAFTQAIAEECAKVASDYGSFHLRASAHAQYRDASEYHAARAAAGEQISDFIRSKFSKG